MEDARIFGIVEQAGGEARVAYLKSDASVTPAMLDTLGEVRPTQVFRYAARCEENQCAQYCSGRCSLGQRIVEMLPEVTEALPSCQIRPSCRWYVEIGAAACRRCPQVMTLVPPEREALAAVAVPPDEAPPVESRAHRS